MHALLLSASDQQYCLKFIECVGAIVNVTFEGVILFIAIFYSFI